MLMTVAHHHKSLMPNAYGSSLLKNKITSMKKREVNDNGNQKHEMTSALFLWI